MEKLDSKYPQLLKKCLRFFLFITLFFIYVLVMIIVADDYLNMLASISVLVAINWLCIKVSQKYSRFYIPYSFKKLLVVVTIIIFLTLQAFNAYGTWYLRKAFTQARKQGFPLTAADLNPNSLGFDKAFVKLAEDKGLNINNFLGGQMEDNGLPLIVAASNIIQSRKQDFHYTLSQDLHDWLRFQEWDNNPQINKKQAKALSQLMILTQDMTDIVEKVIHYPKLHLPSQGIDSKNFDISKQVALDDLAKFYTIRCYYFLEKKQFAQVEKSLSLMFRLARILREEPLLLSQLLSISIEEKAFYECYRYYLLCPNDRLKNIQKIIKDQCHYKKLNGKWELMVYHTINQENLWKAAISGKPLLEQALHPRGLIKCRLADSFYELMQQLQNMNMNEKNMHNHCVLPTLKESNAPDVKTIVVKEFERMAMARCLWVVISATITENHTKVKQTNLDFLSKEKESLYRDPFTQKALSFRKKKDGFYIYSVAQNLKDDGGSWEYLFANSSKDIGAKTR